MQKDILLVNRGFRDINPLLVGTEDCAPGHCFGPAVREHHIIHYIVSGRGFFETEGKRSQLGPGDMFLIHPQQLALYGTGQEQPWRYIWVGFSTTMDLSGIFCKNVISARECGPIFAELLECEKLESSRELFVCGKIYELLSCLYQKVQTSGERPNRYVPMAKNYIESNYASKITVDMMAKYLNLDRSYFSTIFKQQTGKSPRQYLVDYRLEKAAQYMLLYGYSPSEAAISCGYPDIFCFSRMFKKKFGVAPQFYKKGIRQKGEIDR